MLHAVKTSLGSYRIVDGDGTYVIMDNDEFHDYVKISRMLRDDIRRFSRESVDLHSKLQDDLKTIESLKSELAVAEGTIKELSEQKDDLERSISSLKDELAKLTDNLEHAESLNANLKRFAASVPTKPVTCQRAATDTSSSSPKSGGRRPRTGN